MTPGTPSGRELTFNADLSLEIDGRPMRIGAEGGRLFAEIDRVLDGPAVGRRVQEALERAPLGPFGEAAKRGVGPVSVRCRGREIGTWSADSTGGGLAGRFGLERLRWGALLKCLIGL